MKYIVLRLLRSPRLMNYTHDNFNKMSHNWSSTGLSDTRSTTTSLHIYTHLNGKTFYSSLFLWICNFIMVDWMNDELWKSAAVQKNKLATIFNGSLSL